jgi:hypothetical protein
MTEDQKISQDIVKLMWSIMANEATRFEFYGKIYNYYDECHPVLFDDQDQNKKFHSELRAMPSEVFSKIMQLARKLRTLPPYEREPWTHFKITLHDNGKFNFEFAYITQEKDQPSVFMKEGNPAPYPPEKSDVEKV